MRRTWSISLCAGVGGGVGVCVGVDVDGSTVWEVLGVLAVLLVMVVATMVGMLIEVGCVGKVFESSGGGFVVVVMLLEDFVVVLCCGLRMALWCWNERRDLLRRVSLMSVVGNMYVVAGASCLRRWGC